VWGSDVKKLRKEVLAVLGPGVSEEDLNTILAPKAGAYTRPLFSST